MLGQNEARALPKPQHFFNPFPPTRQPRPHHLFNPDPPDHHPQTGRDKVVKVQHSWLRQDKNTLIHPVVSQDKQIKDNSANKLLRTQANLKGLTNRNHYWRDQDKIFSSLATRTRGQTKSSLSSKFRNIDQRSKSKSSDKNTKQYNDYAPVQFYDVWSSSSSSSPASCSDSNNTAKSDSDDVHNVLDSEVPQTNVTVITISDECKESFNHDLYLETQKSDLRKDIYLTSSKTTAISEDDLKRAISLPDLTQLSIREQHKVTLNGTYPQNTKRVSNHRVYVPSNRINVPNSQVEDQNSRVKQVYDRISVIDAKLYVSNDNIISSESQGDIKKSYILTPESNKEVLNSQILSPKSRIDVPSSRIDVPSSRIDVPSSRIDVPSSRIDVPSGQIDVPGSRIDVPSSRIGVPKSRIDVPKNRIISSDHRINIPTFYARSGSLPRLSSSSELISQGSQNILFLCGFVKETVLKL